jgi:hypothetical protein
MRWRRPLAALAAVSLAATAMLALTTRTAETARSSSYVPVKVVPSCSAAAQGIQVRLTGSSLTPGANSVYVVPQNNGDVRLSAGGVTVASDGTLDQIVTVPPLDSEGIYYIYVSNNGSLVIGLGYFSVPCPTLAVQPTCGPADDGSGGRYTLTVSGTGYGPSPARPGYTPPVVTYANGASYLPVHIELDGVEVPGSPGVPNPDGSISVLVTPGRVRAGTHTFHAFQTTGDVVTPRPPVVANVRDATTTFTVPCATTTPTTPTTPTTTTTPTTPTATTTPTTAPVTTKRTPTTKSTPTTKPAQTVTAPTTPVTVSIAPTCLEPDANGNARVQVSGGGFSPGAVDVLLDGDIATKAAAASNGDVRAEVELTPGTADHAITVRQGSRQADATLRVPCASHPKLKLDPAIGPPGFVTKAIGSGFPPNVLVRLSWQPGIGTQTVRTNDKGAFAVSVLVFPQDQTGERALRATPSSKGRFTKVDASFLCVPGSVQRPQTFDFRR